MTADTCTVHTDKCLLAPNACCFSVSMYYRSSHAHSTHIHKHVHTYVRMYTHTHTTHSVTMYSQTSHAYLSNEFSITYQFQHVINTPCTWHIISRQCSKELIVWCMISISEKTNTFPLITSHSSHSLDDTHTTEMPTEHFCRAWIDWQVLTIHD